MESFLQQCFPGQTVQREKLAGDGGHRKYFRLKVKGGGYILMMDGGRDFGLRNFIHIQELLKKAGLPAPRLFHRDLKKGLLILEDLGNNPLQSLREVDTLASLTFYRQALRDLVNLQTEVPPSKDFARFGKKFFLEEINTALKRLEKLVQNSGGKRAPKGLTACFRKEMKEICHQLDDLVFVFCHRDFHSRNLMVKNRRVRWIDFQDGGNGPYCYDLCSLLYDSYVTFKDSEREVLTDFYFQSLPAGLKKAVGRKDKVRFFTRLQFLQRGFKACGCFAGFYNDNDSSSHLPCIRPTLKELSREALKFPFKGIAGYVQSLQERLVLSRLKDYTGPV